MTFPHLDHATATHALILTGRAIDETTGELRHVIGVYVRVSDAQRELKRLREPESLPQRYDRSACPLDRPCRCLEAEHLKKECL